ncbi:MAG: hypothetical protein CV087_17440 [Candidatus Brocadia sp. WS118]|nr:MAG: hypothetical protein CV087_17440 [Candidatus Brocadia sp. WS118]
MKCSITGCTNNVIDFTDNPQGICTKCRWIEVVLYFGAPRIDMMNMPKDEISIDKQRLVEGGQYAR